MSVVFVILVEVGRVLCICNIDLVAHFSVDISDNNVVRLVNGRLLCADLSHNDVLHCIIKRITCRRSNLAESVNYIELKLINKLVNICKCVCNSAVA